MVQEDCRSLDSGSITADLKGRPALSTGAGTKVPDAHDGNLRSCVRAFRVPERSDEDIGPNELALMVPEARDLPTEATCRMRGMPPGRAAIS